MPASLRLTQRVADHLSSKNHNSEKVARMQHIAFLRRGPLLKIKQAF